MKIGLSATAALWLVAGAANAATVEVHIHDVASAKGHVLVQLCTEQEFLKTCALRKSVPATRGTVTARFENVAPARYAGMTFHDENDNGRMDRSSLGVPTEGAAFSRDAVGQGGPPKFADVAVAIPAAGAAIDINLTYY
jgi:uncharacterized protein (DUF2141 family)